MFLVCQMSWKDQWESFMVSHQPAKFRGNRHWGSEDKIFLVAEEEDSICPRFDPPLHCISLFNVD